MAKNPFADLPPVFLSSAAINDRVYAGTRRGQLRKIGPRLYTANMHQAPAEILRANAWLVTGYLYPGAVVAHRTALEGKPAADGTIFLSDSRATRTTKLPGLTIRLVHGAGPLPGDMPYVQRLWLASRARALLENLLPTRNRSGVTRALPRAELEDRLERLLRIDGAASLNRLRDEARELAPALGAEREFAVLDDLIGSLLGTRTARISGSAALARIAGRPYDADRLQLFETLAAALRDTPTPRRAAPSASDDVARRNLAFVDAYFSNYIEGTEFEVTEAIDIVFGQKIPERRSQDAHDVLGTYAILSDPVAMAQSAVAIADNPDAVIARIRHRHARIMERRPETGPGEFKTQINRAGNTTFVAPELVPGTLERGIEFFRALDTPFARAAFLMFLITEVHPFADGNGRVARIMMNAELAAAGDISILIPTAYRDNYLSALRALSRDTRPGPLIQMLDFAQRFSGALEYTDLTALLATLGRCHAFDDTSDARLVLPTSRAAGDRPVA